MFPFFIHLLLRFCALFGVLDSAHDRLYLDLGQGTRKAVIETELVVWPNVS
jgi:hypothetical protein